MLKVIILKKTFNFYKPQVSLKSLTQENEAYIERETGTMDKFGVVRTISKDANTPGLCDYDKFRDSNWGE